MKPEKEERPASRQQVSHIEGWALLTIVYNLQRAKLFSGILSLLSAHFHTLLRSMFNIFCFLK